MGVFDSMVKVNSDASSYAFSRKKRSNNKSPGDPLCFSNCVWEVCLASIKRKISEIWGRVYMNDTIFESCFCYASLVCSQNTNSIKRLHLIQKKSLISFKAAVPTKCLYLKCPQYLRPLYIIPRKLHFY